MSTVDDEVSQVQKWPPDTYLSRLPAYLSEKLIDLGNLCAYHRGSKHPVTRKHVMVITKGVLLLKYSDSSGADVLSFCGTGDVIGFAYALTVDPRCAGKEIDALTTAHASVVPIDGFREFIAQTSASRALLAELTYQNYLEKVRRGRHTLPVNNQVWLFLVDMANRFGEIRKVRRDGGQQIILDINLTQAAIARAVGASTGAVESTLRDLRKRGFITTGYRTIQVELTRSEPYLSADDFSPVRNIGR